MNKRRDIHNDAELIKKHLLNEISKEELEKLENRMKEIPDLRNLMSELKQHGRMEEEFNELKQYSASNAYQAFLHRINDKEKKLNFSFPKYIKYVAAAAIVILIAGTAIYMSAISQETAQEAAVIQPGTSQAKLTLSDGRTVDIKKSDIEVNANGITVHYKKGVLSYVPEDTLSYTESKAEELCWAPNELATPKGGENTVILADGTTVCLNAGSRLVFPVRFLGKQRIVYLEGEGFFDVHPDTEHPFIVKTRLGEIKVLGTAFNVSAYPESPTCLTTLVRGMVCYKAQNGSELILHPGEQAVTTGQGSISKPVDVEEYIGWTKGLYIFKNRSLGDIMDTFSRWYNVEITFDNSTISNMPFSGSVKRYESLNTFLNALKLTEKIDFRIEQGKVIICSPAETTE